MPPRSTSTSGSLTSHLDQYSLRLAILEIERSLDCKKNVQFGLNFTTKVQNVFFEQIENIDNAQEDVLVAQLEPGVLVRLTLQRNGEVLLNSNDCPPVFFHSAPRSGFSRVNCVFEQGKYCMNLLQHEVDSPLLNIIQVPLNFSEAGNTTEFSSLPLVGVDFRFGGLLSKLIGHHNT